MNGIDPPVHDAFTQALSGEVYTDPLTVGLYSTDASMYQLAPRLVIIPRDRADILKAVRLCSQYGLPLLPRGGGTSLTGQSIGSGVVLDLSKYCDRILELNVREQWVRVEPGLVCANLNVALKPHGLHFAPDPATLDRATIGGMIANNAAGMRSVRYGMTIDHVHSLDIALASGAVLNLGPLTPAQRRAKLQLPDDEGELYRGLDTLVIQNLEEIRHRYPKVLRRSGGYALDALLSDDPWNPAKLICGSEGTLGIVLEAKLRLEPLPRHSAVCLAHFATLRGALEAAPTIVASGISAAELLDGVILRQARKHPLTRDIARMVQGDPDALILIEVQDDDPMSVRDRIRDLAQALRTRATAAPVMLDAADIRAAWQLRASALGLMTTVSGPRKPVPYIEDAAVPLDNLADYVTDVLAVCERNGQPVSMFGHASVGLVHIRPLHDLHQTADVERMKRIQAEVFALVQRYGGSWSGEHGDGIVRGGQNQAFFGDTLYQAFREVKRLFDPDGRMNPGKVIDTPAIDAHRRFGQGYRPLPVVTGFHYRRDGGFLAAVEQCTGVAACRKTQLGVMCPSYRATRDEHHSTRGRANALRLALTGQLGVAALTSEALHQALSLCLACKGCAGECPNRVDMTRLKAEALHQRQVAQGVPPRAWFLGRLPLLARGCSGPQARSLNAVLRHPWMRQTLQWALGIDARRPLPPFATRRLSHWYQRRGGSHGQGPRVLLFNDTYLEHFQPQVGQAAIEVLEAAGYRVELATVGDSQRTALSQGLLDLAKREGERLFRRLERLLDDAAPLLVCEPSCHSALVDDLPDLLDDQTLGARIADRTHATDAFLADEIAAGRCQLPWRPDLNGVEVLVHAHCHQQAQDGGKATHRLLRYVPGIAVADSEAGCCGMAGAFGYEHEHADLSRQIAADRLLPRLAALPPTTVVIANGFSCRHQIADLGGRPAIHVMEGIRRWLASTPGRAGTGGRENRIEGSK